ncbi:MAG TPA: PAS domain S-box protein [Methanospirillum sp.]|nr:PAS domain S-box protein [Methanospirillum sp.]
MIEFSPPARVLFIDDEPRLLDAIRDYLTILHSLEVDIAENPADALASGHLFSYDCLVIDYDMPEMDGITLLKAIRSVQTTIPVIVFTGKSREDVVIEAINNGADYYLQKGANAEELFTELAHDIRLAVRQYRADRELRASEERYRAVVEDQTEFICRTDPDGIIRFVNGAFCRWLSLNPDELIGTDFYNHLKDEAERVREAVESCDPDYPVIISEISFPLKNAGMKWISWSIRLLFDASFEPTEILAVGRDISIRKEAERQSMIQRDLGLDLAMASSVGPVLERSLKSACILSWMDTGAVFLRERQGGGVKTAFEEGPERWALNQFIEEWQNENGDLLAILAGAARYYSKTDLKKSDSPFLSIALIPIQRYNEVTGWFALGSGSVQEVPQDCRQALEMMASQIGTVISRIEAEDALRDALLESEERYMQLSESSPDAIGILSGKGFIHLNPAALKLLEVTSFEHFMELPPESYVDSESAPVVKGLITACEESHSPHSCEATLKSRTGREIYAELIAVPISQSGDPAILVIVRDRTDQWISGKALADSERHFRELADLLPEPVFEADALGRITFCNRSAQTLFSSGSSERIDRGACFLGFFAEEDQGELSLVLDRVKTENIPTGGEFTISGTRTDCRSVLLSLSPILTDNRFNGFRGVIVDITEMKKFQGELQRTIREKDILFRELHHRVKNNLQIISSILQLQEEYIGDERLLGALQDCEQRISSMALVHETLYRSETLTEISFGIYLENLAREVISGNATVKDIRTEIEVGEIQFSLDTTVTLGLIINELMINSMKHAFTQRSVGMIRILVQGEGDKGCILTYEDNGAGLPDGFSIDSAKTLGMRLVRVLSRQLQGRIEIGEQESAGVRFDIRFPVGKKTGGGDQVSNSDCGR